MSYLHRHRAVSLFTASVLALSLLCSCSKVSEDPSVLQSHKETQYSELISSELTDTDPISTATTVKTADTSASEASLTETTSSATQTAAMTETTAEETTAAVLTSSETITIQTESPSEFSSEISTQAAPETSTPQTTAEKPVTSSAALQTSQSFGTSSYSALNYKEQKGFWITYLEYDSILKNRSEASFSNSVGEYFDNIKSLGFNTVYVQVRAFGDAYYNSSLFPSGDRFNGTMGTQEHFDALAVMVKSAHDRGLSIHAWVNPMRLMTQTQLDSLSDSYQVKKWYNNSDYNGTYLVKYSDRWYLNPAYDEVARFIADGISEIISNYNVDGIQIDDYFYPTTASSFDSAAYAASGGAQSLSEWRKGNVSRMVKKLCSTVHATNPSVVFGISPQGSIENNYDSLYADVKTWCSSTTYCDYILPQIYFGFDNVALPYADMVSIWNSMVAGSGVKLVIGLAAYKIGAPDSYAGSSGKNEWLNNTDIIARQIELAQSMSCYGGVAIYRYDSIFNPSSSVSDAVSAELDNIRKN